MKGLILLGGHGTRLRPLTYTRAKQLLPIGNKPIAFYAIESLRDAGVTDIGVIVGHDKERIKSIKDTLGDGSKFGVKFTYIEQDEPRGIAHAVSLAEDFVGDDPFVYFLGDNILKGDLSGLVKKFEQSNHDAGILFTEHKTPEQFGCAVIEGGRITGIVEKPKVPPSNLVSIGICFFRKSIFDIIRTLKPSPRNELEIADALDKLIKDDHNLMLEKVDGYWKDTGRPQDVLEANQLVLEDIAPFNDGIIKDAETTKILGKVGICENTIIHPNTKIVGPVIIGKNCQIGPNTYIGPYTAVGDNCEIKGSEIEYSVILDNVTIDSEKKISNSFIGNNSKIIRSDNPKESQFTIGESSLIKI